MNTLKETPKGAVVEIEGIGDVMRLNEVPIVGKIEIVYFEETGKMDGITKFALVNSDTLVGYPMDKPEFEDYGAAHPCWDI